MIINKNPDILIPGGSFGAALGKTILKNHPERTGHLLSTDENEYQQRVNEEGETVFNVEPLFKKVIKDPAKDINVEDCDLPLNMTCSDRSEIVNLGAPAERGLLVLAYPVPAIREALQYLFSKSDRFITNRDILLISKGLEKGTLKTPCQITEDVLAEVGLLSEEIRKSICYLIGPNLAWELIRGDDMITNIAGEMEAVKRIAKLFHEASMTIYQTRGRFGLEILGGLKNALAIGAGALKGLDLLGHRMGNSTRASFAAICRAEEKRLIYVLDKIAAESLATQYGAEGDSILAYGFGDTRNYGAGVTLVQRYGEYLAGKTLSELMDNQVIEGEGAAEPLLQLAAQHGIKMPILSVIVRILKREINLQGALLKIKEISHSWSQRQLEGLDI